MKSIRLGTIPQTGIKTGIVLSLSISQLLLLPRAWAIDKNAAGAPTGTNAPVVLYRFNNDPANSSVTTDSATGRKVVEIKDLADPSQGTPLPLRLHNTSALYTLTPNYLSLEEPNVLLSTTSADKILSKCGSSEELTIELWVQNLTVATVKNVDNESDNTSRPEKQSLRLVALGDTFFKEFSNFGVYQAYNGKEIYKASLRTSQNSGPRFNYTKVQGQLSDPFLSSPEDLIPASASTPQHLIFTRKDGITTFYRSDESELTVISSKATRGFGGTLKDSWYKTGDSVTFNTLDTSANDSLAPRSLDMRLAFGNEPSAIQEMRLDGSASNTQTLAGNNTRFWPWRGNLYSAAIYCRALSSDEILGSRGPNRDGFRKIKPANLDLEVTPELKKAKRIYELMNSLSTPLFDPRLERIAQQVREKNLYNAASLAIEDNEGPDFSKESDPTYYNPSFYNVTVRDFAAPMATRDESVNTELNDFIATVIGVVRDNIDARELLYGDYYYRANFNKAAVPSNMIRDILRSNAHYTALASGDFDLARVLIKDKQKLYSGTEVVDNPDPAGLITTRTFMGAHAVAGTNRRIVEYAFREFACLPMEKWAVADSSDDWIGRDIDRNPGGSTAKFTQSCRSCHSRMDPLRGAFAYYTFSNNFTKNTLIVPREMNHNQAANEDMQMFAVTGLRTGDPGTVRLTSNNNNINYVVKKMNHNDTVFPGGFIMQNNRFENRATDSFSNKYFGWRAPMSGEGAHQFGSMLSKSEAFSRCMTKRVFKTLCKRDPVPSEDGLIQTTAKDFEDKGYKLKYLFKKVAGFSQCSGD